ncbi:hypothetical protein BJ944DRAFT_170325 [Cunninghamella echinulata]|nr:hypothetical protein BJ944DRAFT_170325 [Cunninghamella echinulata]
MKKYGYVSVGIYMTISLMDFSLASALVYFKGADKVKKIEESILKEIKSITGIQLPSSSPSSTTSSDDHPSWSSVFLLAFGIHKTLFLPIRISLTAMITPTIAKKLVKYGWIKNITPIK